MTAPYAPPGTFHGVTLNQAQLRRLRTTHEAVEKLEAELAEARVARAKVVKRLEAEGAGLREISREIGVTHPAVRKMIDTLDT